MSKNRQSVLIALALSLAIFVLDLNTPSGIAAWLPYLILLSWVSSRASPGQTFSIALLITAFLFIALWKASSGAMFHDLTLPNHVITIGGVWTMAVLCARRRKAEQDRDKALRDLEVATKTLKQLSGVLPICSMCKKIRNDGGRWEQLESFIQSRSQAQFTHGLCETCARELSPETAQPRIQGQSSKGTAAC
ncbi:MAG: hypothetical protein LC126_19070 [Bryobacterales bacterium]|nr:hypothetical protein [Bryobacterales bacterium]